MKVSIFSWVKSEVGRRHSIEHHAHMAHMATLNQAYQAKAQAKSSVDLVGVVQPQVSHEGHAAPTEKPAESPTSGLGR